MHVNRFMASHVDDMARANRFKVELHGPVGIRMRGIRCTNVSIPGRAIGTKAFTINQAGPPREHPVRVDYGGKLNLTFMLDTTFEDHQKITTWNNLVYNDAWGFTYPDFYHGTVTITQQDRQGWPSYEVTLLEAWPSAFAAVAYDSAGGEAIQKFDCTMTYRTWTSKYENSPSGLLGGLFKKIHRDLGSRIGGKVDDVVSGKLNPGGGVGGLIGKMLD